MSPSPNTSDPPLASLRIAFFGTPDVAVPTLDALIESRHDVVAVVSQPDRGRGRGRKLSPSPVAQRALDAGLKLLRPEKVGDADTVSALSKAAPDVGVVVAFGQFIPKTVRELPERGYLINAHASLLPRYRGASPIAQAILDGERETGVSIMRVEREMDAGPVGLVRRLEIGADENTLELTGRLATTAGEAVLEALDRIASGTIEWTPQDETLVTVAPKLSKNCGWIDWTRPTAELIHHIHGLAPRPGAFTHLVRDGEVEVIRLLRARPGHPQNETDHAEPGRVLIARNRNEPPLQIATRDGWLEPLEMQRAGGRAMPTDALLRGHPIAGDERLGAAPPKETSNG